MKLWRRIGRQQWAKKALGVAAAEYVRFVGKTTRLTLEPTESLFWTATKSSAGRQSSYITK